MRTDDLVTMLATGAGAVEPNQAARRYATATGFGVLGGAMLMVSLLGVRADIAAAALQPMFWVKLAFVASLAAASLLAAARLSRPGRRLAWATGALAAPVIAIWLLSAVALLQADPAQREALFYGETSDSCPLLIALLAAPAFVAVMWAMRGLAPTRLRLAGAGAGLLAGTVGALVYSLHCPESGAPFIGFWYPLGMLIPTAFGAVLGPSLLRW